MKRACSLALACALITPAAFAEDIYTDPNNAGPDYASQGEYLGEFHTGDGPVKAAAQVIALGAGKYDMRIYMGGLPGDGWGRGDYEIKVSGEKKEAGVYFENDEGNATIKDGVMVIRGNGGDEVGKLKKVTRKSPTLGMKPPQGALVLFDGTTADHFEGGKMTEDKLLMANCSSKEKLGDHMIHLEFRTPFKPTARGQARGNSGVYAQSRYEIQVLDSFGLEGENNECGGIYQIAKPKVNMAFPPLTWQTYDIDFQAARYNDTGEKTKNARVTIKHNGVVIHEDLELPKNTPGKLGESPEPQGVYLQGHGNPVVYRNIWVVKK